MKIKRRIHSLVGNEEGLDWANEPVCNIALNFSLERQQDDRNPMSNDSRSGWSWGEGEAGKNFLGLQKSTPGAPSPTLERNAGTTVGQSWNLIREY